MDRSNERKNEKRRSYTLIAFEETSGKEKKEKRGKTAL